MRSSIEERNKHIEEQWRQLNTTRTQRIGWFSVATTENVDTLDEIAGEHYHQVFT